MKYKTSLKTRERVRAYYLKNKELRRAYWRKHYWLNREKAVKRRRKWYQDNKEKNKKDVKSYRKSKIGKETLKKARTRNKQKFIAREKLRQAVRSGKIVRLPCEVCKTKKDVHAHHSDYSKPFDVKWLCREHHWEEHRRISYKNHKLKV